jgi:glycosyltransferase involved in cell wall biosynthesis
MPKFTSIIVTSYSSNPARSKLMRSSFESLKGSTKSPYELIVVDNGGSAEDSRYLLDLCEKGFINVYLRNANNMHFGFARNQALRICNGDYIAVCDNDIYYNEGWLEECLYALEQNPDKKIWATPIYNVAHWRPKYWDGKVEANGKTYRLNRRAGSNCWVMRRKDFEAVGDFYIHRVAGTKWTNRACRIGYLGAVTPDIMVNDQGFRRGYNLNAPIPVKLDLHGSEVYFNQDEFYDLNPKLNYISQASFSQKREKPNIA